MFGGIQEELAALGDLRGKVSGRLRINAAENPAYYLIYPKVRSFLAAFPEVDVEILISNSWSDIVAQGFDFGVRPSSDVAQDMVSVPISGERAMCVVVAPDYLTRHGQPETPSELVQHRCIVPAFNAFNRLDDWEFFQNGQIHRVRVPASLTFNSTALIKTAARRLGADMAAALCRRRQTGLGRTGGTLLPRVRRLSADGLVLPAQPPQNAGGRGVD